MFRENTIDLTDNGHALRTFTKVSRRPGTFSGDTFKIEGVDTNHSMGDPIELIVHFNSIFKDNFLPPEGVYTTGTYVDGFPASDKSLYNIVYIDYMTYTPDFFYYTAAPNQKVYVKWINGKINIMTCSIIMNGKRNGSIYPTPMLLSITES